MAIFCSRLLKKQALVIYGDGLQTRDYVYVDDVVEANILAWKKDVPSGEIFNIGRGKNFSINELAKLIGGPIEYIPRRPGEYPITLADNSKAGKILGWEPKVSLEEGIAELKKLHGL